ncbi:hypothetical protein CJP74_06425 [Psittacicella melopsittaci]|uniref:Uncharacterized protein n=1 Tax=Psittacicella melopsittaci TaxID=2028576 RepID=A0A3A1Y3C6_9GAMM|nr:hypothetical protein [Psittacicella melopsittaci]RIY31746.1 hypothetical protein CJP74_06425 [Psittacicella melopsittaci]
MSANNTYKNFNWGLNGADSGHQYKMDDELRSLMISNSQLEINSRIDLPSGNNITKLLADPTKVRSRGIIRVSMSILPFKAGETNSGITLLGDLRYYFGYYQPVLQKVGDRTGNYTGSFVLTKPGVKLTNENSVRSILDTLLGLNRFVRETLVDEEANRYKASLTESDLPAEQFRNQLTDLDNRLGQSRNNDPLVVQQLSKDYLFDFPANTPLVIDASQDLNAIYRVIAILINSDVFYQFREIYFALDKEAVDSFGGKVLNIGALTVGVLGRSYGLSKRNLFVLGKEHSQIQEKHRAELGRLQKDYDVKLQSTQEEFGKKLSLANQKFESLKKEKDELTSKVNSLEEDTKELRKENQEFSAALKIQTDENEKAREKLTKLAYGLGTQLEYLNKALEAGDTAKAKDYIVSFEVHDPSKSLLEQYKPYYENLQSRAKSLQNLDAAVKRKEETLKQDQAKFNAQKQQYTLALELQDYLVREKVLNHTETPDTAIAKLSDAIVKKGGFLTGFLLWFLGLLIGILILGICTYFISPVKKLFLDPNERSRLKVEDGKFFILPHNFSLSVDTANVTTLSNFETTKKQTSELTIVAVKDVSGTKGFENLNPTQLNSDIQDLVNEIKEFAGKASVRVVVKVESEASTSLTNVNVLVDNKSITLDNFNKLHELHELAKSLQQEIEKYNKLSKPNSSSRGSSNNQQIYNDTFTGIDNKCKELLSLFNQIKPKVDNTQTNKVPGEPQNPPVQNP